MGGADTYSKFSVLFQNHAKSTEGLESPECTRVHHLKCKQLLPNAAALATANHTFGK